jgi:membrane-associated phospholipid phosphatase
MCAAALAWPASAHAQPRQLRWDAPVDFSVTLGGAALWLTSVALHPVLAPRACRWCDADAVDLAARDSLAWRRPALADEASDLTAGALAPTAAIGLDALASAHDRAPGGAGTDALLIFEATVLALDLDEITKLLVARERPYLREPYPDGVERPRSPDDFLSFFSGHTTEAFALASASGTVASMRGYRWAPAVWAAGETLAAATGYLRIAADRHWLTDVLVGLAVGVGVGVAVPLLFHSPVSD